MPHENQIPVLDQALIEKVTTIYNTIIAQLSSIRREISDSNPIKASICE